MSAYVSIRQHTSAYVSIRLDTVEALCVHFHLRRPVLERQALQDAEHGGQEVVVVDIPASKLQGILIVVGLAPREPRCWRGNLPRSSSGVSICTFVLVQQEVLLH